MDFGFRFDIILGFVENSGDFIYIYIYLNESMTTLYV